MHTPRLSGQVALVTGASRGIGRAVALSLAREGASVGVNHPPDAREAGLAAQVVETARAAGVRALAVAADVADTGATAAAVGRVVEAFGRIDILVTSAGISHHRAVAEMTEAEWDRVIAVNLKGTFNAVRAVVPHMIRRRSGRIVTIASELGLVGRADMVHYCASKGGVIALTKALAREMAPHGVRVNSVAPGPTETDMLKANPDEYRDEVKLRIPLGRWGQPEDVARTVLFLVSEDGAYYAGQVLSPNGGVVM
jgi:3-oxoacyl-[acyl-carrier protein] reductase